MFNTVLRAFEETARAGSIRKASQSLGVAPSSVSRNIAVLEHEIGTKLLERRAVGIALTHAGELVAAYARSVLLDYDSLRADLDDMRGTQRRLLRIVLVESVASYGPIGAIARFSEKYRAVSFNLRLVPAPRVVEAVRQDQCEIGLAFCAEPAPDITILARVPEPIMLAVPAAHALSSPVGLRELTGFRLALPDADFGIRQIFDRACARAGVQITPVLTSNVFETLRDFVRCGAGAAILPRRAIARAARAGELKAIPLEDTPFRDATIDVIVLRTRRLPRVVKAFADILIAQIRAQP
ncbi:MAG TPA: LysR family transcriptional regulator [Rhizomicrobium sp.]